MKNNIYTPKQAQTDKINALYQAICSIETTAEAERFLTDLCTPAEINAMADRWHVVDEILARKTYRQIHEETDISITTIGRVARCITYGAGGYQLILKRIREKYGNQK